MHAHTHTRPRQTPRVTDCRLRTFLPAAAAAAVQDRTNVIGTGNVMFGADEVHVPELQNVPLVAVTPPNGCGGDLQHDLIGKVALIERGDCTFVEKVLGAARGSCCRASRACARRRGRLPTCTEAKQYYTG